jgi:hypothetical protein
MRKRGLSELHVDAENCERWKLGARNTYREKTSEKKKDMK